MHEERVWLDQLSLDDVAVVLAKADCRELRNPELARLRAHTRDDLLLATEQSLQMIKVRVDAARRP